MRDDRRDLGGADKLAQTAPQERWPAGTYQPDLGGCIPESGDVCEGWKTDSIDGLMVMKDENKEEKKGRLDTMKLIIIGISLYLIFLFVEWLFIMD